MDVIIAVMGITGSGKSSFIESVTGRKDLAGDSLRSETSNIQSYHLTIESTRFVLIDTPGFDDTFGSDADILKLVEEWLTSSYKSNCLLSGLLYLHPVNKPRVDGSSLRSLKLFRALCGEKNFANVVIGTTFWDSIGDLGIGLQREKELCESADFWGPMMRKGSRVVRFLSRDYSTAAGILLDMAKKSPCVFQIQEETVIQGKSLQDTSAGIVANPTPNSTLGVLANEVQATLALQAEKVQRGVERQYEQQAEQMRLELEKINLAEAEERRSREAEIKRRNEAQERALEKARRAAQQAAAQENKLAAEMEHLRCENERRDMLMRSEDALMRFNRTKVQQEEVQRQVELLRWGMGQNLVTVRADPTAYAALIRWCDKCQMNIGAEKYYCCLICMPNDEFDICQTCYDAGHRCRNSSHRIYWIIEQNNANNCQRAIRPELGVECDRCGQTCKGFYMHCCLCDDDNFDLCLTCTLNHRTCRNRSHTLKYGVKPVMNALT